MKRSIVLRFVALALFVGLASYAGTVATAGAQDQTTHYDVAIWNPLTHDYPVTGTMDITYLENGIVRGYYHPAGLPSFIPITGGHSGDHVWLTIGQSGQWMLNGHVRDGKISGSATRGTGVTPYSFTATPH